MRVHEDYDHEAAIRRGLVDMGRQSFTVVGRASEVRRAWTVTGELVPIGTRQKKAARVKASRAGRITVKRAAVMVPEVPFFARCGCCGIVVGWEREAYRRAGRGRCPACRLNCNRLGRCVFAVGTSPEFRVPSPGVGRRAG